MTAQPEPAGFTIAGAVAYSGLSRTRIYEYASEGKLTLRRAGKRTIILGDELRSLLAALPPAPIRVHPREATAQRAA